MSKTTKILIAVVVVFAAIYAIQRFTSRNSTTEKSRPFAGMDTAKVNLVSIDYSKDITIERTNGGWNLTSPVNSPASPGQMSMLLTQLASNPHATVVADNLSDSSAYGLGSDAPFASFKTSDGKTVSMRIGDVTPDFDGCYIQLQGKSKVYQLSTNLRSLVGQPLTEWRDKQMFNFSLSSIEDVDFSLGDTLFHFFHRDTTWRVNDIAVPQSEAQGIVEGLIGSRALGFIDSTIEPAKVIIDYGVTLNNREHITGQIFKSAESEATVGQLCLSNSANHQTYAISSTLPQTLLQQLRELQIDYLTKVKS